MTQWEACDPPSFKEGGSLSWNRYSRSWRQARSLKTGKRPTFIFPKYYSICSAKTGGQGPQSKGDRVTNSVCLHAQSFSHIQLFVTPWTVAHQAALSMGFSRKNTGVGCHFLLCTSFFTILYNLNIKKKFFCNVVLLSAIQQPKTAVCVCVSHLVMSNSLQCHEL